MEKNEVVIAIVSLVAGIVGDRLLLSRKEKHDIRAQQAATSRDLLKERQQASGDFQKALRELMEVRDSGDKSVVEPKYWNVRAAADVYLAKLDMIASYIRRGDIDTTSAAQDHFDELALAARKVIPEYYAFIWEIAREHGLKISDQLDESTCRNLRLLMSKELSYESYMQLRRQWNLSSSPGG